VRLEQFRTTFSRLYPSLRLDNGRPTQIVIFKDAAAYFDFLPKRPDGSADVGVAGYFQAGEDTNYITFAISPNQFDPLSTAVHEYVHSVLDSNFDKSSLPPWLNEGLAEYFETLRVDGGNIIACEQQVEHLRLLRRSAMIPLREFFSISSADLKSMSFDRRRLYYAQAWAVVQLLMHQKSISLTDPSSSVAKLDLENQIILDPSPLIAKLEAELNRAVRGLALAPEVVALPESLPSSERLVPAEVLSAQRSAVLGDLLLHTGELARAETLLRQALAGDKDSVAAASLGVLLIRQEKIAEAKPYLEKAIAAGSTNPLVLTGYAYTLMQDYAKDGGISVIPDEAAKTIRANLKYSIEIAPRSTEAYRLLAMLNFIRDENLDEAVALLQKGLTVKKEGSALQILLARILLRREDVTHARQLAEQVSASSLDVKQKAEADEIVKAAYDYTQTKAAAGAPVNLNITLGEREGLVILKRSWLTDADIKRIDDERVNNNLNRIIIRPVTGERQLVGRIEKIACIGSSIVYRVRTTDKLVGLTSSDFSGVRMTVATEGENTFQIGCGVSLDKQLAVINYRPGRVPAGNKALGDITAISFVPDNFRLKSIEEMASARLVAIDDDTLRRSGPSPVINDETIAHSISQNLRKPLKGEERIVGTIQKVECTTTGITFNVLSDGQAYRFAHPALGRVSLNWFTVASSQLSIGCGSGPLSATSILTISRATRSEGVDGELKAIEFVPDGFVP